MSASAASRGRPFMPGQSGNPGGRASFQFSSALARRYQVDVLNMLVRIVRGSGPGPNAAAGIAAGRMLTDMGFPGWSKDNAPDGAGNALHLHLLAVMDMRAEPAAVEAVDQTDYDALAARLDYPLLPPPALDPAEAGLELWEQFKAKGGGDGGGDGATSDNAAGDPAGPAGVEPAAAASRPADQSENADAGGAGAAAWGVETGGGQSDCGAARARPDPH